MPVVGKAHYHDIPHDSTQVEAFDDAKELLKAGAVWRCGGCEKAFRLDEVSDNSDWNKTDPVVFYYWKPYKGKIEKLT